MHSLRSVANRSRVALTLALLTLSGCASARLPAIDPTGQRIFLPQPAYTTINSPFSSPAAGGFVPQPAFTQPPAIPDCAPPAGAAPAVAVPMATPLAPLAAAPVAAIPAPYVGTQLLGQDRLILTPARLVAPVGSEVVLLGGICGPDGYYVIKQPVEWLLSQDSVGTLIDVGESSRSLRAARGPRKLSNNYAVTRTSTEARLITRGTPDPSDDVWLRKGQAWITVSSPSEGVSYVTAVATGAENWEKRRQVARIHWVDAQWVLPSPSVARSGESHQLTTTVSRSSSGQPVRDWIVRYEVADGVPAVLDQSGAKVLEQRTDATGRATVQVFPETAQAGSTRIHITILSPTSGEEGSPIAVGEGWATVSWSAPGLALRATGPQTAALDATATYRIEVTNSGDLPARNVSVTAYVPQSLAFLNSTPAAQQFGDRIRWTFDQLAAGSTAQLEFNCRAARPGDVRLRVEATADGLSTESTVATRIVAPALEVRIVDGPETAAIGERVQFNVEVANIGSSRLTNVVVRDDFPRGLEHTYGERSPIERTVGDLEAGQVSQFGVSFFAREAGRQCHSLQAVADGGHVATARGCVEVVEPQYGLSIQTTGPTRAQVGDEVEFRVEVTNTGDVPLTNLQLFHLPSRAVMPKMVSPGYESTASGLRWDIRELQPGRTETRRIVGDCTAPAARAEGVSTVTSAEGARETDSVVTVIAPAAGGSAAPPNANPNPTPPGNVQNPPLGPVTGALKLAVNTRGNTVRVGDTYEFVIELVNDRSDPDRDVVLSFTLPDGLEFRRFVSVSTGLTVSLTPDGTYEVETIREMRPSDRRLFRVEVTARATGDQTLRARAVSVRTRTPIEAFGQLRVMPN